MLYRKKLNYYLIDKALLSVAVVVAAITIIGLISALVWSFLYHDISQWLEVIIALAGLITSIASFFVAAFTLFFSLHRNKRHKR